MRIIQFEDKYRDDMIFMILEAKNALGRVPRLNPDLLDIKKNYFEQGGAFWLALDDNDRVIGSIGFNINENHGDVTLHRFFVKCELKRQGIGTALLKTAEEYIKSLEKETVYINLGAGDEWLESRAFYTKHGYVYYGENEMKKHLI